jgi:hypothetical protein
LLAVAAVLLRTVAYGLSRLCWTSAFREWRAEIGNGDRILPSLPSLSSYARIAADIFDCRSSVAASMVSLELSQVSPKQGNHILLHGIAFGYRW